MSSCNVSIPVSEIRQYCFCPRIPYFQILLNLNPPSPLWAAEGKSFHEKAAMLQRRRNLNLITNNSSQALRFEADIHLKSEKLGIHGVCDGAIFLNNEAIYPLEFKTSEKFKCTRGHILQLTAYSLLLEEKYNSKINEGFLLYGSKGKSYKINITDELKTNVLSIIDRIHQCLEDGLLPSSSATEAQCSQCEFLNFCGDRF